MQNPRLMEYQAGVHLSKNLLGFDRKLHLAVRSHADQARSVFADVHTAVEIQHAPHLMKHQVEGT